MKLAAAAAKSLQLCLTLCDPIGGSPPGSPVPGILQARTLEWVAISFSNAWKWKVKGKSLSRVWLLATPWTAAHQAPPPMGVFRQEYWSGVPSPSPIKTSALFNSPFKKSYLALHTDSNYYWFSLLTTQGPRGPWISIIYTTWAQKFHFKILYRGKAPNCF